MIFYENSRSYLTFIKKLFFFLKNFGHITFWCHISSTIILKFLTNVPSIECYYEFLVCQEYFADINFMKKNEKFFVVNRGSFRLKNKVASITAKIGQLTVFSTLNSFLMSDLVISATKRR